MFSKLVRILPIIIAALWIGSAHEARAQATCTPSGAFSSNSWHDGFRLCAADLNANNTYLLSQISGISSITVTVPSYMSVTGSPLTANGTIGLGFNSEAVNLIFAGPCTGPSAAPAFRNLCGADLPFPSSGTLGGIESLAFTSHLFISSISTSGVPNATQPACADLSDASAFCNGTNAANLTGTAPNAVIPDPTLSALGGVEAINSASHRWLNSLSTSGIFGTSQPACADISDASSFCNGTSAANLTGTAPNSVIPTPTTGALGGIEAVSAATAHQWVTYVDTSGIQHFSQPAFTDISSTLALSQIASVSNDTVIGNASGSSGSPTALPLTNCHGTNQAENYTTSSGFGCASIVRSWGTTFGDTTAASALTSGSVVYFTIPYACTIQAWNINVDAGTVTFDIWKIATGTAVPTVTNTITASAKPALSTGTSINSTTLTGWTTSVAANDIIGIQLNTVATAKYAEINVQCT